MNETKTQGKKCVHRGGIREGGWQTGGVQSEKCAGKKVRGGKGTLSSDRMGETDMGEMIGGPHFSAQVGSRHRNRNGIDQLTLKMVLLGEEGQEKKSEGSNCMG